MHKVGEDQCSKLDGFAANRTTDEGHSLEGSPEERIRWACGVYDTGEGNGAQRTYRSAQKE